MVDPLPDPFSNLLPTGRTGQTGAAGGPQPATSRPDSKGATGGAEFQSLLERIEDRARELARQSDEVSRPDELAGAVDTARTSLEEVLDLKQRLLEAYRQQQQQSGGVGDAQ